MWAPGLSDGWSPYPRAACIPAGKTHSIALALDAVTTTSGTLSGMPADDSARLPSDEPARLPSGRPSDEPSGRPSHAPSDEPAGLLTLAEASLATGRSVNALRKLIARGKIQRVRSNDGLVRIRLDPDQIASLQAGAPASQPAVPLADQASAIKALEAAVTALTEALADVRGERDRALARIAELERAGERPARKRTRWWPFRKRRQREEAAIPES